MKWANVLWYGMFFLVFVSFSFAECPGGPECGESQIDFDYTAGDYSEIVWSEVNDWSEIDYTNPTLHLGDIPVEYADEVDVAAAISAGKGKECTVEQIAFHLSDIGDLSEDVDVKRAQQAIEMEKGVRVAELLSGAHIEGNTLICRNGNFDFTGKNTWKITVNKDGQIFVLEPGQIKEGAISLKDSFTFGSEVNLELKDGKKVAIKGLSVENGQYYVNKGMSAKIGYYGIAATRNFVDVYFDEEKARTAKGNFILITDSKIEVATEGKGVVHFKALPGNKLFNMVKKQYKTEAGGGLDFNNYEEVADERDRLIIEVSGGNRLVAVSRAGDGKTPEMMLTPVKGGGFLVRTGLLDFRQSGFKTQIDLKRAIPPALANGADEGNIVAENSVPFVLRTFVSGRSQEIVFSSSNLFSSRHEKGEELTTNRWGLEVNDDLEYNSIKTIADLKARFPDQKFMISSGADKYKEITPKMAQFIVTWLDGSSLAQNHVNVIEFDTKAKASAEVANKAKLGTITFGERMFHVGFGNFDGSNPNTNDASFGDHELEHVLVEKVISVERSSFSKEEVKNEGVLAAFNKLGQEAIAQIKADPEYQKLGVRLMTTVGVDFNKYGPQELAGIYDIGYGRLADNQRKGLMEPAEVKFILDQLGHKYVGLPIYALRQYKDTRNKASADVPEFAEIPTVFKEVPDEQVKKVVEKGGSAAEFYAGNILIKEAMGIRSHEDSLELLGSYCNTHSCNKCEVYPLACKKDTGLRFYDSKAVASN